MFLNAVPYEQMLSASILERLPLVARLWRMLGRRRGGVALALHTYTSKPGKPAELRYKRLILITEVLCLQQELGAKCEAVLNERALKRNWLCLTASNCGWQRGRQLHSWLIGHEFVEIVLARHLLCRIPPFPSC